MENLHLESKNQSLDSRISPKGALLAFFSRPTLKPSPAKKKTHMLSKSNRVAPPKIPERPGSQSRRRGALGGSKWCFGSRIWFCLFFFFSLVYSHVLDVLDVVLLLPFLLLLLLLLVFIVFVLVVAIPNARITLIIILNCGSASPLFYHGFG